MQSTGSSQTVSIIILYLYPNFYLYVDSYGESIVYLMAGNTGLILEQARQCGSSPKSYQPRALSSQEEAPT